MALAIAAAIGAIFVISNVPSGAERADSHYASTYRDQPQEQQQVASLWIGDSYTAGVGADSSADAESCLTAEALGWSCELDAQGSTGFVAGGQYRHNLVALPGRLKDDGRQYRPDVIVIDAGRNDVDYPLPQVEATAARYFTDLRHLWPNAKLVFVAPYAMGSDERPMGEEWLTFLRQQAEQHDAVVVDPIGEGWITAEKTRPLMIPEGKRDALHPTPAGHRYIAEHLAASLRRQVGQS